MLFYKFPFDDKIFTTGKTGATVDFFPFKNGRSIHFPNAAKEILRSDLLKQEIFSEILPDVPPSTQDHDESTYVNKITDTIELIKEYKLQKLVVSRIKEVHYEKISLTRIFLNLCKNYNNAFAYFFVKDGECWIGAFSELLGKYNKNTSEFVTMSLAGTMPVGENWTPKEIEEQKPVSEYILKILQKYAADIAISETHDHVSGNIKHLRTDFSTKIAAEYIEPLVRELHPTPAVCGIPQDICSEAISKFENFDRKLYAGYIRAETGKEIYYFVNLRCAEFYRNHALIHTGSGITELSNPQTEWRETELKADAILKNILG